MKKTILIMGGMVLSLLSATVYAQQTQPTTPPPTQPTTTQPWDPAKNPTVDSITAPFRDKMLPARPPVTTADIFPVIGKYTSTTNPEAASVTISLDDQNKGLVWVDGLPQGRIKAMLRKSPSTYKIPAQKTADGKDVAEGTLIFDKVTGALNICIGKPYNSEDPATAFTATPEGTTTDANTATTDATTTTPKTDATTSTTTDATTSTTDMNKTTDKVVKTKTKVKGQPTVKTKVKTPEAPKPWMYSGTKVDATVMN